MSADTMRPVPNSSGGKTTTITNTSTTAPNTSLSLPVERPRLHLDERAEGQAGDGDRGARRTMVAERRDVHLVDGGVVVDVPEEERGLGHVSERGALALEQG